MLPFALASADALPPRPDGGGADAERWPEPSPEAEPTAPSGEAEPVPGAADLPDENLPDAAGLPDATPFRDPAPEPPAIPPPGPDDLPPPQAPPEPAKRPLVQRLVLALLLIAAAGLIGYMLSRPSQTTETLGVLARSVEAAGTLRLAVNTDLPAEAQQFVRDEFGWRVGVPTFSTATLRGVALARAAPSVEVPVFLYTDGTSRDVAVFAYSYALLDQVPDRLTLARDDYAELDLGAPVVRRTGRTDVLLWRDRDDIYVAVTDLPPSALRDGLSVER